MQNLKIKPVWEAVMKRVHTHLIRKMSLIQKQDRIKAITQTKPIPPIIKLSNPRLI
jgi:hypothetical protein